MEHFLARRGYIFLYLILYICIAIGISFIAFLLKAVGMAIPAGVLIGIKAVVLAVIPLICAYRFLLIENRPPTTWETYFISLITFLPVLLLMALKTGIIMGAASQNPAIDMESFAAQSMLNLLILSGVCLIMLLLSYGTIAKILAIKRKLA